MKAQPFIFVPSPNDNVSPFTGSANATRLYEIAKRHIARGGEARFIMGQEAAFDYPLGECTRVYLRPYLKPRERWCDLITGWLGMPRYYRVSRYINAANVIERSFSGPIFLYNDAAALTAFGKRCPQAKMVLYCGNQIWTTFSQSEIRRMLRLACHVICISEFLAADLDLRARKAFGKREYEKLRCKIVGIPNGVDLEMFQPRHPDEKGHAPPLVLFVGRVQPVKGAHLLIEAARQLQQQGIPIKVRIVGSHAFSPLNPLSEYEENLRELAAPLGDSVEFQPFVSRFEIAEEYRKADIYCMPSVWQEPFGLTLLEGMATGLPTVASRRGAIPHTGGEAIRCFEPTRVEELTAILKDWAENPSHRREWGLKARCRAEEFSWDRHFDQLMQVLG